MAILGSHYCSPYRGDHRRQVRLIISKFRDGEPWSVLPPNVKNQAVKKFHEVARWGGHEASCPGCMASHPEVINRLRLRSITLENSNCLIPMQIELVFYYPPPFSAKRSKSLVKTKSVQVSPPPQHITTTPCTFTEWQKAFVGPHQITKISGQKPPINH